MYICSVKQKTKGNAYYPDEIVLEFNSMVDIGMFLDSIVSRYPADAEFSAVISVKSEEKSVKPEEKEE